MLPDMKGGLLIVSKKWSQGRGKYTSVERFCELLDSEFPTNHGQRISVPPFIARFFKNRTNSVRSEKFSAPYTSYSFELEIWGLLRALKKKPEWVFFPYADYDFYYWRYFKRLLKIKLVLWSFFSEKELQERFEDLTHFEKADLVLVAGKSQLKWFVQNAPNANAVFFPIGVDTEFFVPGKKYNPTRIVHVGSNRRDFKTLIAAMDILCKAIPNLELVLVGASSRYGEIPERDYLTRCGELGDEEYRTILQTSNFGILSLEDGGSSNSLLEYFACGLPAVVTSLGNICDYFDSSCCLNYSVGDFEALARQCIILLEDNALRNEYSINAVKQARKFDWLTLRQRFFQLLVSQES